VVIAAIRETLRLKAEKNAAATAVRRTHSFLQKDARREAVGRNSVSGDHAEQESVVVAEEGTIHPKNRLRVLWDLAISLTLVYYALVVPMRIALELGDHLFILDYILDAVNVYENYLHMSAFAVYSAGELLVCHSEIRAHYLHTRRTGDLVASLPYDLIALAFLGDSGRKLSFVRAILRLPKLLRLRLSAEYFGQCKRQIQKTGVSSALVTVIELTCSVLTVTHWVACVFYMLAEFGGPSGPCVNEPGAYYGTACQFRNTWVGQQISTLSLPQDGGTQWLRFLKAQYWALSNSVAVTLGDMMTMSSIEVMFCFFVTFFGLCINGMILGSVMNLVQDASEESNKVYRTVEVMQAYLSANSVPPELVKRAVAQMRHLATTEGSLAVHQTAIFAELPHSIRLAIDNEVKTIPYLRRCPIFDFCSDEILRGISAKLQVQFNVKDDTIITGGELGHEMFFVESGSVRVMSADGSVHYSTLEEGTFFGETALFFRTVRSATVLVSSPFCVCLRLSKFDLEQELRAADYDPEKVIAAFRSLQSSNERRNKAVTANLALAKDPKSKLFKLLRPTEVNREHESWLHRLRTALSPSSHLRMYWDLLGLLLLMYYTLSIVFYIAFFFGPKVELYTRFIAFDFLIDLYWAVDIVLKAYVFSFKADIMHDRVVTDGELIWKHYRDSGYVLLDVAASIPFEFLALIPGSSRSVIFVCRVNHLLRVCQLPHYAALLETHLQEKLNVTLSRAAWCLLRFAVFYFLACHWLACGYFMIHRYGERHHERTYVTVDGMATWDPVTGQHDICSFAQSYCYGRSLYFVLNTVTGIGYGDIAPRTALETAYQMLIVVIVMFIMATLHGFCFLYLEEHDAKSSDVFNAKMQMLQNYISYRQLTQTDGDAILAQYTHMWRKVKSTKAESNEVLSKLSQSTAMDLSLHLQAGILNAVPLLKDLSVHTRRRIATVLHPQVMRTCLL
jgi:CRP-like cAMP-binding protein